MRKWLLKELMIKISDLKTILKSVYPFKQFSVFKFEFSDIFLFETKLDILRGDIVSLSFEILEASRV